MYANHHGAVPPPQAQAHSRSVAPETFLLDQDAQQSLPADSVVALQQVDNLKYFLISAPVDWQPDQYIRRFLLPTGEYISCVLWNNLFHISGTDIVRCLSFRFQAFGRPVKNSKKFEEGIFSDLRNLKSGTDASLEEPKSAFLDFLYKNNCIRTQKKQKVFYWYSVPHDRLFLDALERDLKREKMGQEATTVAVNEPALSFEFDSSQSLFEQLTKAQQTNSSSFNANVQSNTFSSQSTSPVMRSMDSMPPPSMVPQSMPPTVPEEPLTHMANYNSMAMPAMSNGVTKSREQFGQQSLQFDRNGVPISQVSQRHSSMPAYMEYSPAPSFVSSHYEDYSTRGLSFEPLTPPQQSIPLSAEPAYIANEDTGLYTAIPDAGISNNFNSMMQLPPSNLVGPQFSSMTRTFPSTNVYSVIEGSPTYKQRRRRSSLSAGISAAVTATGGGNHQSHRPSDLRRSMSSSVVPVAEADESGDSPTNLNGGNYNAMSQHKELLDLSRHGTPLAKIEDSPIQQTLSLGQNDDFGALTNGDFTDSSLQHNSVSRSQAPVFRRARSATMMELGPYPTKSHSCPIPTCGRLFKRLEHLKRHKRTHEANKDGEPLSSFSEEDLEGDDDQLGSLEEESPQSDQGLLSAGMGLPTSLADMPTSLGALDGTGLGGSHMIAAQNF
ncbi:MAG: homeodomain transcription factor ste12 [Bathelium mastoideum]|nr:MAG: homeodomain transcription factor ste12 [Bathelium mastoideum]KAI9687573.1 MAG: homeodomain transcription factor ste12 [Bathelium mastoideum]